MKFSRRNYVRAIGSGSIAAIAGCLNQDNNPDDPDDTPDGPDDNSRNTPTETATATEAPTDADESSNQYTASIAKSEGPLEYQATVLEADMKNERFEGYPLTTKIEITNTADSEVTYGDYSDALFMGVYSEDGRFVLLPDRLLNSTKKQQEEDLYNGECWFLEAEVAKTEEYQTGTVPAEDAFTYELYLFATESCSASVGDFQTEYTVEGEDGEGTYDVELELNRE